MSWLVKSTYFRWLVLQRANAGLVNNVWHDGHLLTLYPGWQDCFRLVPASVQEQFPNCQVPSTCRLLASCVAISGDGASHKAVSAYSSHLSIRLQCLSRTPDRTVRDA